MVRDWMLEAKQHCPTKISIPELAVQLLRARLHKEEAVTELVLAFFDGDMTEVLDSLADSLVVILGTAVACGIPPELMEAAFLEVMRSNNTKLIDGYQRPDGKFVKGPSFEPPNLAKLLAETDI